MEPSADTKLVARYAISTFAAPPNVWRFTCKAEELCIDIGGCADRPLAGVFSYTTIGLSDYELSNGADPPVQVELAAACASDRPLFPSILAAAAMQLIRRGEPVRPGGVVRDVIADFYPRATVAHLYLTRPFLWGERLKYLHGQAKSIAWLLAVPVTSGELLCLEAQGDAGLEQLYQQRRIDMYSLARAAWL
jgi:antitoxin YqcF